MPKLNLSREQACEPAPNPIASRRAKIVLAGIVLAIGIAGALQFRKPRHAKQAVSPSVSPATTNQDFSLQPNTPAPTVASGQCNSPPLDLFAAANQATIPAVNPVAPPAAAPPSNTQSAKSEAPPAADQTSAPLVPSEPAKPTDADEFHTASGTVFDKPSEAAVPDLPAKFAAGDASRSTAPSETQAEPAGSAVLPRTHKVVDGDSLALLAERYLGSASRANEIFSCNRDLLSDPELLPIGARLRIPSGAAPSQTAVANSTTIVTEVASAGAAPAGPLATTPASDALPSSAAASGGAATSGAPAPSDPQATRPVNAPLLDIGSSGFAPLPPIGSQSATVGKIYVVQSGDTLSGIAQKVYSDPARTDALLQANREQIHGEQDLRPGMILDTP